MTNHSFYTLGEASKATGKAKGTIKNAISKGRLSARKNEVGEYEIDPAELHRVYKPLSTAQDELNAVTPPHSTPLSQVEKEAYEAQIALLREMLDRANQNADDWKHQAQQSQNLLTDQREKRGGFLGLFKRAG